MREVGSLHYQLLLDVLREEKYGDLLAVFPEAVRGVPGTAAPVQNVCVRLFFISSPGG